MGRNSFRSLAAVATAASGLVCVVPVRAQTVTLPTSAIIQLPASTAVTRVDQAGNRETLRKSSQFPLYVNRDDCLKNDKFQFPIRLSGQYSGYSLQVWASTAGTCDDYQSTRSTTSSTCWELYSATALSQTPTVEIASQNIVGHRTPSTAIAGAGSDTSATTDIGVLPVTPKVCDINQVAQPISLEFMIVDGSGNQLGVSTFAGTTFQGMGYDVTGPSAPAGLSANGGETRIHLTWTDSLDPDISGYRFFCDPSPQATIAPSTTTSVLGLLADAGLDGSAGTTAGPGTTPATDAGTTAGLGTTPATDAGTTTTTDAGTGSSNASSDGGSSGQTCHPGSDIVAGATAPSDSKESCGSVTGKLANSGTASGLTNGVDYAVGVAAFDLVGNSGNLSNVVCTTPVEVTDFFELYRGEGGQGGGGLCNVVSRRRRPSPAAGLSIIGAFIGARTLRRLRRRR